MQRVKSIGVLSLAKTLAVIYGAMGLIFVPFFLLFAVIGAASGAEGEGAIAGIFGVGFAIMMPIFYAGIGFIGGALVAWLYNLIAGWTGGIELELTPSAPQVLPVAGTVGRA